MKNILIITAHPTKRNLTRGIVDIYKEEKEKQGHTINIVDLYEDVQLPYYSFESLGESKFDGYHLFGGMDTRAKNVDKMFKCVKKLANR